jgi:uncharacterized membrane protein YoaK (UPF0700 family)
MSTPAPAAGAATLDAADRDGPLPSLLIVLTFVTGLVDTVSYLALGHVFVGNMTGNILFLAFALAGVKEFSVVASLIALAAFIAGALSGGLLGVRAGHHRGRLLAISVIGKALFVGAALAVVLASAAPLAPAAAYVVIALLAFAMGSQNAVVRRISVSDITTNVLTTTLTALVADSHLAGGGAPNARRRLLAVTAMFAGAAIGAGLVFHRGAAYALALALGLLIVDGFAAYRASKQAATWTAGH